MTIKKRKTLITIFIGFSLFSLGADDLQLSFIGDIMAHDVNFQMKDYDLIYAQVKSYFEDDDLTFGNLEFPIVEDLPFSTWPLFNARSNYVRAALNASIEVFSLANNHSIDKGQVGALKTLSSLILLKESYNGRVWYSGLRGNEHKPFTPETIYQNGYKIGFIATTQFMNLPQSVSYVNIVDYNNPEEANRFIEWVRSIAPRYDLLVLSYHGDLEYKLSPQTAKVTFFRKLIQAGITILWGHHPHVLQPYEVITVDGSDRLIMYSLGNFVSGQGYYVKATTPTIERAYTADSAIMRVTVQRNSLGKVSVTAVKPVLISNYTTPQKDIVVAETEKLANATLYGDWQAYYQIRLKTIKEFFATMSSYLPVLPDKN